MEDIILKKVEDIKKELSKYNINIINVTDIKKGYVFSNNDMMLYFDKKGDSIKVSFKVSVLPDQAALYMLILNKFEWLKDVIVVEVHDFDENNKIIFGKDALNNFEKNIEKRIISNFVKEQTQLAILHTSPTYNC